MNQVYTITAENAFGSATAEWTLLVGDTPLPGLTGYYYQVDKDHDICSSSVSDYLLDLFTIRQDISFDHPFEYRNGYWEGIPSPVFQGTAYIEWKGYMNVEEAGEWMIQSEHIDGYKMYLDDSLAMDSYFCNDKIITSYRKITLTPGYHKVSMQWFTNHNDFIFILKVKRPSDEDLVPIPENLFVHMPESAITSTIPRNQFYVGRPIPSISLQLFATQENTTSFSVSPNLPSGLTLSSGQISGTPTQAFEPTNFEISATIGGSKLTATFNYAAYTVAAPAPITVTDSQGHQQSEVRWPIYKEIDKLTISCGDVSCKVEIQPSLPADMTLSSKTLQISGTPLTPMDYTTFTITASTEEKAVTSSFGIVIPSCEYGHYYYISSFSSYDMYLMKNGELIESYENVEGDDYSLVLCTSPDTYDIAIRPNPFTSSVFSISLVRDDEMVFFETKIQKESWFNTTWEMVQKVKPDLYFEITEFYVRTPDKVAIPFEITGISKPLAIDPPLSDEGSIEKDTVTISVEKSGKYEYVFTVENDAGINQVTVVIYADQCPENAMLIVGSKAESVIADNFVLTRESDNKVIIRQSLGFETKDLYNLCLEQVPYILTINTSGKENQQTRPVMLRDEQNRVIGSFIMGKQVGETERLNWISLAQEGSDRVSWISSRSVGKKWKEIGFNERRWTSNTRDLGSFSSSVKTAYFRYHAQIDMIDKLPVLLLDVKANGGFVMYVNGVEVLRINLPSGSVAPDQMARRYVDLSEWTRVSISSEWLQAGDNVIAIELHCYSTGQPEDEEILFEMNHVQLTSSIHFITDDGTPTGSMHSETSSDGARSAFFDFNDYTYWEDTHLPVQLRFTFPNSELRLVNRMVIRGNIDGMYHPLRFEVFGVSNQTMIVDDHYVYKEVRESILVVNNPYLFDGSFKEETFLLSPTRPYSAYELEIHQTKGGEDTARINNIRMYYDHHYYCPQQKEWVRTPSGSFTYGKCPLFNNGQSTRVCNATGTWDDPDRSTCLSRWADKTNAFLDIIYRISNCTLELYENGTREAFRSVLVREMTVKEENVFLYLPRRCESLGENPAVCVNVRLEPHRLTSQYVKMELELFNQNATALFYKKEMENVPPYMEIIPIGSIRLYERMSGKDILVTVVIAVLALLCLVLLVMYYRKSRGERYANKKQLSKKTVQLLPVKKKEPEPLLSDYIVCFRNHLSLFDGRTLSFLLHVIIENRPPKPFQVSENRRSSKE